MIVGTGIEMCKSPIGTYGEFLSYMSSRANIRRITLTTVTSCISILLFEGCTPGRLMVQKLLIYSLTPDNSHV